MRRTWGAYRRKSSARASGCPLRKRSMRPCGSSSIAFLLGERRSCRRAGSPRRPPEKYSAATGHDPPGQGEAAPSGEAEAADLLGQFVAAGLVHAADHLGRERREVLRCGARLGDEEVRVLLAHVRVADPQALEAGVLDETGRRQFARRVLEVAAAAGVLERMLASAQGCIFGDALQELVTVAVVELERGGEDDDVAPRLEQLSSDSRNRDGPARRRAPCLPRAGGRRGDSRSPTLRRRRRCRRSRRRRSPGCWRRR